MSKSSATSQGANQNWMSALQTGPKRRSTARPEAEPGRQPACVRHRDILLKSVSSPVTTPVMTGMYRLSLGLVAAMVLLIPVGYILTAAFSVWLYFRHVVGNAMLCSTGLIGILLYVIPVFFGPFVIFFLFKPFFIRGSADSKLTELKRSDEPELYSFVERLCESIGAPSPDRICINMQANAAAAFLSANPFSSRLQLVIGIPLAYRLTLRQFTGVLAHEFGHFSQRFGMRISFLIRSINSWLARSLVARDATDEWLENHLSGNGIHLWAARWILYIGVSVARSVIWLFLCLTNAISFLLVRQMEFDADRVEVALSGDAAFMTTHRRIVALGYAEQLAQDDLIDFYKEGRLVDDFPRLIAMSLDDVSPKLRKLIDEHESKQTTRWFDTHPSQQARFDNAKKHASRGAFQIPESLEKAAASMLFRDIRKHAEQCTLEYYKAVLGSRFNDGLLYPIEDLVERKKVEMAAAKTLHRYFQVHMPVFYPFPLAKDAAEACEQPNETLQELKSSRKEMLEYCEGYRKLLERHSSAESSQMDASSLEMLQQARVRVEIINTALAKKTTASQYARLAEEGLGHLALSMLDYEAAAGQRLSAALRLATHPKVIPKVPDGESVRDDVVRLVRHTLEITDIMGDLRGIRLMSRRAIISLHHLDENMQNRTFIELFINQLNALYEMLKSLHWKIGGLEYPFDHAEGDKSLGELAMPDLPEEYNLASMFYVSNIAFERLATTQMRLFGRLAVLAEKVESALGFSPLPEYEHTEKEKN
ncbi:MAG: M48 family metallopeptidase [Planctomycetaceae bacterium]